MRRSPARLGRRLGQALFWGLAIYVVSLGTRSVVTQVFGLSDAPPAAVGPRCLEQLARLENSLLQHASRVVADRDPPVADERWFADWDARYQRFSAQCEALGPTRLQLRALRQRTEALLARFRRDQLPLVRRIDERLRTLGFPTPLPSRDD